MRILLIQPAIEDFYTTPIRFYPLGLLYIAALLRDRGHEVRVLDSLTPLCKTQQSVPVELRYILPFFKDNPYLFQHYFRFGARDAVIVREAENWQPDLIGITSQFTAYFEQTASLATALHERLQVPIILGGHHVTAFSAEIKKRLPFLHQVLTGPAETSLPAFMQPFDHYESNDVDWRVLQPTHALAPAGAYRIGKKNYISLIASRGCPFFCDFCSVHAMFGAKISYRSVTLVVEEMRWNYEQKRVRIFNFEDDNLACKRDWFMAFLQQVQADPVLVDIELTAMNGLCHATLDEEVLVNMKKAGFREINLSYVTQDKTLQRQYHRPNQMPLAELVRIAQRLGFSMTIYVIIGLPEQTYAEIKDSIDYLTSLGVLVGPSVFYIPPASPLYDRLSLPESVRGRWSLYRSSAFAVETEHLQRGQLVELFAYARQKNLERRKR
jgi:radical SAM superfamily enzyme YgiQ (UPF0313 family)